MRTLCLTLLLAACNRDKDTDTALDTGTPTPDTYAVAAYGQAPWDPMRVVVSDDQYNLQVPYLDGEPLTGEVSDHEGVYAWQPDPPLSAGTYTLSAEDGSAGVEHTVLDYGRGEAFSAKDVAGTLYALDFEQVWLGRGDSLRGLLAGELDGVWLRLTDEEGAFEVLVQATGYDMCRALVGTAALSETGELTWAADDLEVESEQGTFAMQDFALRGGWLDDGSAVGGVSARATVHTVLLSEELAGDPDAICANWAGFGLGSCHDCIGDGDYCVDLRIHAGVMLPDSATAVPEDLPACGLDLSEAGTGGGGGFELPEFQFDCEFPDLSCASAVFGMFGLVGLIRRRRDPDAAAPDSAA